MTTSERLPRENRTPAKKQRRSAVVTMQDVARAAGVSTMTVSNVINDRPHVRGATRQKVLDAIAELGYRVNVAARNLRSGHTGTIGLAVPEVDSPYFGQLAAAIIENAAVHDYRVVIEQTGRSRERELDALALSRNRMYDGLILSTVGLGAADSDLLRVDYPVVILGERIFDGPVDHVGMPNVEGARAATAHLIESGCRRIALIDSLDSEVSVSSLRHNGYRQALTAAGIVYDPTLVVPLESFSIAAGAEAGRRLLDLAGVDGVFCVTDSVALGVLRALADGKICVPRDIKVIGFDNIVESAYSVPSLSTIDPDHASMARTAVDLIVRRIGNHGAVTDPQEVVSAFRLIVRESSSR